MFFISDSRSYSTQKWTVLWCWPSTLSLWKRWVATVNNKTFFKLINTIMMRKQNIRNWFWLEYNFDYIWIKLKNEWKMFILFKQNIRNWFWLEYNFDYIWIKLKNEWKMFMLNIICLHNSSGGRNTLTFSDPHVFQQNWPQEPPFVMDSNFSYPGMRNS